MASLFNSCCGTGPLQNMVKASVDPEILKQQIENQLAEEAPATVKPFFPCCGGPVSTMEKCSCMVPADQQDSVKQAIEKYKSL
ncbi:unnamed protein product [Durusdinium trenchii]|uniref:Uncharacterized protein n=1 Tax=Durusdinium trenchii TaxID=1381693 RepID=A0ABP0KUB3_9DINO